MTLNTNSERVVVVVVVAGAGRDSDYECVARDFQLRPNYVSYSYEILPGRGRSNQELSLWRGGPKG